MVTVTSQLLAVLAILAVSGGYAAYTDSQDGAGLSGHKRKRQFLQRLFATALVLWGAWQAILLIASPG